MLAVGGSRSRGRRGRAPRGGRRASASGRCVASTSWAVSVIGVDRLDERAGHVVRAGHRLPPLGRFGLHDRMLARARRGTTMALPRVSWCGCPHSGPVPADGDSVAACARSSGSSSSTRSAAGRARTGSATRRRRTRRTRSRAAGSRRPGSRSQVDEAGQPLRPLGDGARRVDGVPPRHRPAGRQVRRRARRGRRDRGGRAGRPRHGRRLPRGGARVRRLPGVRRDAASSPTPSSSCTSSRAPGSRMQERRSASSPEIVGYARGEVVVEGRAGHAGTTPMELRDDALVKAAALILRLATRRRADRRTPCYGRPDRGRAGRHQRDSRAASATRVDVRAPDQERLDRPDRSRRDRPLAGGAARPR